MTQRAVLVFFFGSVFFHFAHPLADGDLWWHLSSGRFIVEHGELPEGDPFSYTVSPELEDRARMFVRSNWLAQVGYYALYLLGGFGALRAFNAALFTLTVAVLYCAVRRAGLPPEWAALASTPAAAIAWFFDELRPLGFSVLLTTTFFLLLERSRSSRETGRGASGLWLLVPLSALWANLHRGFPVMSLVLAPYLVVWLWQSRFRESLWLVAAGLASLLNPNGPLPWIAAVSESFQGTGQFQIMELAPPWEFARIEGAGAGTSFLPVLVCVSSGSLLVMALDWRKLRAEHLLLYGIQAAAGLTAFRYSIYFVIVAVGVSASSLARLLQRPEVDRLRTSASPLAVGAAVALLLASERPTLRSVYDQALPTRAVEALLRLRLPGPLLNTFDWGGYISWTTWPAYRVFLDSRLLDYGVFEKLSRAGRTTAEPLLREYGIRTVLYPTLDSRQLRSQRLVRELLANDEWLLVYFDAQATVFAKRGAAPWAPEVPKRQLADQLLSVIAYRSRDRPLSREDRLEAGALLRATGRPAEAAALLDPSSP